MNVRSILAAKGDFVATIDTEATVSDALRELKRHNIASLVVTDDGEHIDGILSERDVARALCDHGPAIVDWPTSSVMVKEVTTCEMDDSIPDIWR